jgi:hypothetical protein
MSRTADYYVLYTTVHYTILYTFHSYIHEEFIYILHIVFCIRSPELGIISIESAQLSRLLLRVGDKALTLKSYLKETKNSRKYYLLSK